MADLPEIPDAALKPAAPLNPAPDDLAIYVLNVGDGDAIVLEFPEEDDERAFAVIDSNDGDKSLAFLRSRGAAGLSFVCATHPHIDHIRGLRAILRDFKDHVGEYWDSGFRFTSNTFHNLIDEVVDQPKIRFIRPTSGYETFINGVRLTVLSPSIWLRNRYDSYGIDPNNASIVLRVEYPAQSPVADTGPPPPGAAQPPKTRTVILGGDAQTDAWARVIDDFPHLVKVEENWAQLIKAANGRQPLFCDVLKVSHHASKHGINLELVERMGDASGDGRTNGPLYLVSSCDETSTHGFPHAVAQAIMREVRQPIAKSGAARKPDHRLGIHYTAQQISVAAPPGPAGSVAIVLHRDASSPDIYRLCDGRTQPATLATARKVNPPD